LFYDFRPPSAGPYERSESDIQKSRYTQQDAGRYYRLMMDHVKAVLADIGRVCPEYDLSQGYQLGGFVWFQGWNDMVNRNVYPLAPADGGNRFAKYSDLLSHLIRDVRKDLGAPELPVVIGVMGVGGDDPNEHNLEFRQAMQEPASRPEFKGNVIAIQTSEFWDDKLGEIDAKYGQVRQMAYLLRTKNKNHANKDGTMTAQQQRDYLAEFEADLISPQEAALRQRGASNAGYHYLGCAKTFALMGQAYANALIELEQQ
jgi:hypothetical protein